MQPAKALLLRSLAGARVRTLSFAALFFLYGVAQVAGYKKAYPSLDERLSLARTFGNDASLKLFYGTPHHIETVGGYADWRVGGVAALAAAFFGILAGVRAFRSEDESGRSEIVAAGAITRRTAYAVELAAAALAIAVIWLALTLGILAGGLSASGAALLALGVAGVAAVYLGIGIVAGRLMPSGGAAMQLGGAVFGIDFLLRVIADIGNHQGLHWLTPLGWAEETRAFTGAEPGVLLLPLAATIVLAAIALAMQRRQDLGAAVFAARDTVNRPRLRLLRSPALLAVRLQALSLVVWLIATAIFSVVVGSLAQSVISSLTPDLRRQIARLGAGQLLTAEGVIGFYFLFFVVEIALYCCVQIGSVRGEEAGGRLETLFALRESRTGFLGGRLVLAAIGALLIALTAAIGCAAGAAASGADVSWPKLLEAGLNCLPASMLFLGLSALLFALAPRQGSGIAYALVTVAFVWYLVGALLGAPGWLLGLSPFDQIGFVPAVAFRAGPAAAMVAIGAVAAAAALVRFRGRDLAGA